MQQQTGVCHFAEAFCQTLGSWARAQIFTQSPKSPTWVSVLLFQWPRARAMRRNLRLLCSAYSRHAAKHSCLRLPPHSRSALAGGEVLLIRGSYGGKSTLGWACHMHWRIIHNQQLRHVKSTTSLQHTYHALVLAAPQYMQLHPTGCRHPHPSYPPPSPPHLIAFPSFHALTRTRSLHPSSACASSARRCPVPIRASTW